jgi:hypothetical protein
MALKAVNDTAGPNGLVPTLLVFGAFPRISLDSPPTPSTLKRAEAITKAMRSLRKYYAEKQVSGALNARNGPDTTDVLNAPLQSEMLVWREKEGWQGPYKLLAVDGHDVTLDLPNGPIKFRSTMVKKYFRDDSGDLLPEFSKDTIVVSPTPPEQETPPRRTRGRPPGSRNKPKTTTFLTQKEKDNYELALKLRRDGVITTPGEPFEASDDKEITDLIARGVFRCERFNHAKHSGLRLFSSRTVREVKGKTEVPYEKSRLIIQGHSDEDKKNILTQSPTIQRASQRLIVALAPRLIHMLNADVELRDVTQAYPQSKSKLFREILARLPTELQPRYPPRTIMRVVKPLYGIAEAGVHWWATYYKHHREKLGMQTSTFDPCLLISADGKDGFGIVGMQTDDTLLLTTKRFSWAKGAAHMGARPRWGPTMLRVHARTRMWSGPNQGVARKWAGHVTLLLSGVGGLGAGLRVNGP